MRIKCTVSEWQRPIRGKPSPVIFDAPPIWDTFLSAFCLSLRTNSPLDCGEIWHEHVVYFGEDFYQIASESDVPFPSAVDFTANPLSDISGAPSMAGTIFNAFNKLLRTNGTLDSDEIFHEYVVYFEEDSCQISRQSNVPFSSADRFMHETHHLLFRAQFSSWRQSVIADEWHDRFS